MYAFCVCGGGFFFSLLYCIMFVLYKCTMTYLSSLLLAGGYWIISSFCSKKN